MPGNGISVVFSHGKDTGPWGVKILALAKIAQSRNLPVDSVDYTDLPDPDLRVKRLERLKVPEGTRTVLVGSSMGGYVSVVASGTIRPAGLFLMAPAFYLDGYADREPEPHAERVVVVHGWRDEVVPPDHSIRFARRHRARLHLVDADHTLVEQVDVIGRLFRLFLEECVQQG